MNEGLGRGIEVAIWRDAGGGGGGGGGGEHRGIGCMTTSSQGIIGSRRFVRVTLSPD